MKYIYPQPIARVTHIPTPAPLVELGLKRLLPPSLIHTTPLRVPDTCEKKVLGFCVYLKIKTKKNKIHILYIVVVVVVFVFLFLHCYYIIAPRSPTNFSCHQNVVIEHTVH